MVRVITTPVMVIRRFGCQCTLTPGRGLSRLSHCSMRLMQTLEQTRRVTLRTFGNSPPHTMHASGMGGRFLARSLRRLTRFWQRRLQNRCFDCTLCGLNETPQHSQVFILHPPAQLLDCSHTLPRLHNIRVAPSTQRICTSINLACRRMLGRQDRRRLCSWGILPMSYPGHIPYIVAAILGRVCRSLAGLRKQWHGSESYSPINFLAYSLRTIPAWGVGWHRGTPPPHNATQGHR
jgi:hypothetical protein